MLSHPHTGTYSIVHIQSEFNCALQFTFSAPFEHEKFKRSMLIIAILIVFFILRHY